MYKLRIPEYLVKFIRGLHPELKRKLKGALKIIIKNPDSGKSLKDELAGLRSIRVSRFRIIYRVESPKEIQIVAIGPRTNIYEETYRLIKKETKDIKK
ncbi:type II toxin-antitoxin system RelE/ParE family toxin [Thermodesulfobacteriota bacterium]